MRYNSDTLLSYCKENYISLIHDYSKESLSRDSTIEFVCTKCNVSCNKKFRQLLKTGAYCKSCMNKLANDKISKSLATFTLDVLNNYCFENKITLIEDYSGKRINRNTFIKGKCITENCQNTFNKGFRELIKLKGYCFECALKEGLQKSKETSMDHYGVDHPGKHPDIKNQRKETIQKLYGVDHISQSETIKKQKKQKSIEKYGVEHVLQAPGIREQIKKTNLMKYGFENASKNPQVREKMQETVMEKYGITHYMQTNEFKEKCKATCLQKYGVEHHLQNAEIAEKHLNATFKNKSYTFPSGKTIQCQGYEPFALDDLTKEEHIDENDILTNRTEVPEIWYIDCSGNQRRHYVDIFIKSQNRCIEVKSRWTNQEKNCVFEKQHAGKQLGYNYEVWVYEKNGLKEIYK
jgi:hypothetical protein